jgi:hypothetical protein
VVLTNKNVGVCVFLLNSLQHVSTQRGHHQSILEEYTDGDGIHTNCIVIIQFCRIQLNAIYALYFKFRLYIRIKILTKQYKDKTPVK